MGDRILKRGYESLDQLYIAGFKQEPGQPSGRSRIIRRQQVLAGAQIQNLHLLGFLRVGLRFQLLQQMALARAALCTSVMYGYAVL